MTNYLCVVIFWFSCAGFLLAEEYERVDFRRPRSAEQLKEIIPRVLSAAKAGDDQAKSDAARLIEYGELSYEGFGKSSPDAIINLLEKKPDKLPIELSMLISAFKQCRLPKEATKYLQLHVSFKDASMSNLDSCADAHAEFGKYVEAYVLICLQLACYEQGLYPDWLSKRDRWAAKLTDTELLDAWERMDKLFTRDYKDKYLKQDFFYSAPEGIAGQMLYDKFLANGDAENQRHRKELIQKRNLKIQAIPAFKEPK